MALPLLIAQTTQPVHAYSPDDIANAIVKVIGAMALVLVPALIGLWKAIKDASQAKTMSEANSKQITENRQVAVQQMEGVRSKVVDLAHSVTPPAVPPVKADDYLKKEDL